MLIIYLANFTSNVSLVFLTFESPLKMRSCLFSFFVKFCNLSDVICNFILHNLPTRTSLLNTSSLNINQAQHFPWFTLNYLKNMEILIRFRKYDISRFNCIILDFSFCTLLVYFCCCSKFRLKFFMYFFFITVKYAFKFIIY